MLTVETIRKIKLAHVVLGNHPAGLGRRGGGAGARVFEFLAYLHAQGVTHGGIKPANVFLEQDGRTVLLDFNAARVSERPGTAGARVALGLPDGISLPGLSRLHAAPERLQGSAPTPSGDVFSASSTVYEMIAGCHPFRRMSSQEAADAGFRPQRISSLRRRQWRELQRGLCFDPQARPTAKRLCAVFDEKGWWVEMWRMLSRGRTVA